MEIRSLIDALTALYRQILKQEQQASEIASWVHPDYRQSALNLYHYLVLRSSDLRDLHDPLSDLGVSSLRSAEGYVLRNLHDVVRNLNFGMVLEAHCEIDAFASIPNDDAFNPYSKG